MAPRKAGPRNPTAVADDLSCMLPSGRVGTLATPSGNAFTVAGMLKITQWVVSSTFFIGALSGSCMMRVKLTVPAGALAHARAGETGLSTAAVYLSARMPPSVKEELDRLIGVGGGPAGACASAAPAESANAPIT